MKIAILGTRGIPNNYGGFEQFAEYLSLGLVKKGHEVYVYNSHNHAYKEPVWNGVNLIHCFDPEYKIGTAGQFLYDLNCIRDARKRNYDIILQLGYTSSSVWSRLFPKGAVIATNMDGLEWKRTKYGKTTQKFLKYAEKLAVKLSDHLISDSIGIQKYLMETYNAGSEYIPYGAIPFENPDPAILSSYTLQPMAYDLLIARLEPENSIEMILDGYTMAGVKRPFVVIGNYKTTFGKYLTDKFSENKSIFFIGPQYDLSVINNLRYFSNLYFHGHTVGGTNPSLLEAMGSHALIAANRNKFNATILGDDAYYFSNANDVSGLIQSVSKNASEEKKIKANLEKIANNYSWQTIVNSYEAFFKRIKK